MAYEGDYKKFPNASNVPYSSFALGNGQCLDYTNPFGPNWAVNLLPYIEQTNLYNQANTPSYPGLPVAPAKAKPSAAGYNLSWMQIAGTKVKTYTCPSDPNTGTNFVSANPNFAARQGPAGGWARGNYGVTAGYEDYDHVEGGNVYSSSKGNVAGMNGMVSSAMMSANYGAAIAEVTDGTSQTAMVAELRAGLTSYDPRGVWAAGFSSMSIMNGGRDTYNPTPNNLIGGTPNDGGDELQDTGLQPSFCTAQSAALGMGCSTQTSVMTSCQSRSKHTGGVNVCMGDGSVRFVQNSIDELNWIRMLSKSDGQVITYSN